MDRLSAIADASYKLGPPGVKALAQEFFQALDMDRDGRVSLSEYLVFMTQQGHTRFNNPKFFKELDRDNNGSLDFWEVLTLYYIVKSGRPVCDCCGVLIPGTFFSCVECFDSVTMGAYSLCMYCLRSNYKGNHGHNGRQGVFLDSYTLLENKRCSSLVRRGRNANLNQLMQTIWIPAKELSIRHAQNPAKWQWTYHHHGHSLKEDVAKLLEIHWLEIKAIVDLKRLKTTSYSAFLVFKLEDPLQNLEKVTASIRYAGEITDWPEQEEGYIIYLDKKRNHPTEKGRFPQLRSDGWMEIKLGEFSNKLGDNGEVEIRLRDTNISNRKSGLVVRGIDIRSHNFTETEFFDCSPYVARD